MAQTKHFPEYVGLIALIGATALGDILDHWFTVPVARGLGWSLAGLALFPFARRYQIPRRRVLILAFVAGALALIGTFIMVRLGWEG